MKISKKKKKESRHWLDDPANVKKLIRGLYWLCGLVIGIDIIFTLFWHKHAIFKEDVSLHTLETLPHFTEFMALLPVWVWFMYPN